ncbi:MAG: mannosyltransferase [marine bacterium B5-7]|nr:MAG: mannosyltransferase [marine bacterium B5-7]
MSSTIQIIHDLFQIKGGGERLIQTLCEDTGADLLTGHIGPDTFNLDHLEGSVENLSALSRIDGIKTWRLAQAFKQHKPTKSDYQHVIYSGVASPLAINHYPQAKNIFYCHTPPRFVYDKRTHYAKELNFFKKIAFKALINWFQPQYEAAVDKMDVVLTNSNYVKKRIHASLGITAEVVYPPCDTQHFKWQQAGDFYLSLARHDELKRVDQIINAFKQLPDKKLVIASGGQMTAALKQSAAGHDNISFTGWLSENELLQLIGSCLATIYIPVDEDFGMSPVESMSAGKPVLCADHGGLLESVIDQETGFYINNQDVENDLIQTINSLNRNQAQAMRRACEARALLFDTHIFLNKIKNYL